MNSESQMNSNPQTNNGESTGTRMTYEDAMALALTEAGKGLRGANPLVGAVLLDAAGELLGVGHHRGAGTAHAEAAALATLRPGQAKGATMLVTLEPCAHVGRMPACSRTIIDAGIKTVVYAVEDPDQSAAGGAQQLRDAGLEVIGGVLAGPAAELNRRWFEAVRAGRPYTSVHIAQTLDGRIAAADGSSQWISSTESLAANHALRTRADAMLVGTGTVFADDPRLTARRSDGSLYPKQPKRVVLGLRELPADAALRGDGNWLQLRSRDPLPAVQTLKAQGIDHLMVEGGAQITAAFLRADLVDELIVSIAPTVLGAGTSSISDLGIETLSAARHFGWDQASPVRRDGTDLTLSLIPQPLATRATTSTRGN